MHAHHVPRARNGAAERMYPALRIEPDCGIMREDNAGRPDRRKREPVPDDARPNRLQRSGLPESGRFPGAALPAD